MNLFSLRMQRGAEACNLKRAVGRLFIFYDMTFALYFLYAIGNEKEESQIRIEVILNDISLLFEQL